MKITIQYPSLPVMVIESAPEEFADLLVRLSGGQDPAGHMGPARDLAGDGVSTLAAEAMPASSAKPASAADSARPADSAQAGRPVPPKRAKPAAQPAEDGEGRGARLYGGKPNRRAMVLEVLLSLTEEGVVTPSLKEIEARFSSLHPDVETRGLDQVIRDLANKTDLVDRAGRGTFQLTASGLADASASGAS